MFDDLTILAVADSGVAVDGGLHDEEDVGRPRVGQAPVLIEGSGEWFERVEFEGRGASYDEPLGVHGPIVKATFESGQDFIWRLGAEEGEQTAAERLANLDFGEEGRSEWGSGIGGVKDSAKGAEGGGEE